MAKETAQDLFIHLENIDIASAQGNYEKASDNYRALLKDLDEFLQLIPGQTE